jgi:hypothetical protein
MKAARSLCFAAQACLLGCGTDPTLERLLQWQEQDKLTAIAAEPVPPGCASTPFTSRACPRIHAIRAHACLALANRETDPHAACPPLHSASARQALQCAVDSYAIAVPPQETQSADLRQNRARAFYCGARLLVLEGETAETGAKLARRAVDELSRLPPTPAHDHLAASSALFIANRERLLPAERCAAAHQADLLASRGLNAPPPVPIDLANMLRATKNAALQAAATIDGCK